MDEDGPAAEPSSSDGRQQDPRMSDSDDFVNVDVPPDLLAPHITGLSFDLTGGWTYVSTQRGVFEWEVERKAFGRGGMCSFSSAFIPVPDPAYFVLLVTAFFLVRISVGIRSTQAPGQTPFGEIYFNIKRSEVQRPILELG